MDNTLFDDLVQSLKEAKAISKGEALASRRFTLDAVDVKRRDSHQLLFGSCPVLSPESHSCQKSNR